MWWAVLCACYVLSRALMIPMRSLPDEEWKASVMGLRRGLDSELAVIMIICC